MFRLSTLSIVALAAFVATANADERAFGLDGSVYHLKDDKSYDKLDPDTTTERINFTIESARDLGKKCALKAVLTNNSQNTIRFLKQCFKVFSHRGGDSVCFTFGGGHQSQSIRPNTSADAMGKFDKGACAEIVGAEPYFFFGGRDPSGVAVDGLAPFEARQIFNFPDTGIIKLSKGN